MTHAALTFFSMFACYSVNFVMKMQSMVIFPNLCFLFSTVGKKFMGVKIAKNCYFYKHLFGVHDRIVRFPESLLFPNHLRYQEINNPNLQQIVLGMFLKTILFAAKSLQKFSKKAKKSLKMGSENAGRIRPVKASS